MKVLIVNQEEVIKLLSMGECVQMMERALIMLSHGNAIQPLRNNIQVPTGNILSFMPSYLGDIKTVGAKIITVYPKNHGTTFDAHQGAVLLFETTNGSLIAVVDATAVTGIRTAAVSAVASNVLAKKDASDLALLGAGTQARAHLESMLLVRPIKRVRVWSIYKDEALAFADRESRRWGIKVEALNTAQETVEGAADDLHHHPC